MPDPAAGDTHVPAPTGDPKGDPKAKRKLPGPAFLTRMYDKLKGQKGELSQEAFEAAVRHAAGHAGGVAAAERRRATVVEIEVEDDETEAEEEAKGASDPAGFTACQACKMSDFCGSEMKCMSGGVEMADLAATEPTAGAPHRAKHGWRLFVELPRRATDGSLPDWLPYLPKPGNYQHKDYGTVTITAARNARFVDNFKRAVYQSTLPLDAEHATKLSGALAWIEDMRLNADGSADARVGYTDRGDKMLSEDRFRYISPEWFDTWTDPATGQTYQDVAIGGAFCTKPFFKDQSLRPIRPLVARAASEGGGLWLPAPDTYTDAGPTGVTVIFHVAGVAGQEEATMDEQKPKTAGEQQPKADPKADQPQSFTLTAEQFQQFTEGMAQLREFKEANAKLAADVKTLTETNGKLTDDLRTKRFTDLVNGHGGANDGQRWFGDPAVHVTMLNDLTRAFGEDSDQVKAYTTQQTTIARQMATSNLWSERGSAVAGAPGSALERLNQAAAKFTEADPKLTKAAAFSQAMAAHPELYDDYLNGR